MVDTLPQATARDLQRPLPLLLPQDITGMRMVAGLSMRQLARRMGVSAATLSSWESGQDVPTRANTYKLLDELMAAQREADAIRTRARRLRHRGVSVRIGGEGPSDAA